jgi:ATP-binding cassette, subfamily B, bacterial
MSGAAQRDWVLCRRLIRQARPCWPHIALFFVLSLLASPLALLKPLPLQIAVDSAIGSHPLPRPFRLLPGGVGISGGSSALWLAAGLLVAITLLNQFHSLGVLLLRAYTGEKLLLNFRAEIFRHAQRLSLLFHDTKGTTESLYRIQHDAGSIQTIVVETVVPFITAIFTVAGMLYVTFRTAWQLALIAVGIALVLFIVGRQFRYRLRANAREVRVLEKSALAVMQEVLQGLRVVKAFVREESERDRYVSRSSEGMRARLRLAMTEGQYDLLIGLLTALGTAGVLFAGVRQVQAGALTLGGLLLLMGYLAQLFDPLKTMARKSSGLQTQLAAAERAFGLLDEMPEVVEHPNPRRLVRASGAMAFGNVGFAYGRDRAALRNVTFRVNPGNRVGICGETGAGKTTLVSLMLRFYDPTEGYILLDGIDLRDLKLSDLRNQIAFVPQEPLLFSTSIGENIRYARPGATQEEIMAAAKSAHAHEFISRFPQGYDTLVGERGMCVSGGERQRISLARAFLKNAPILILDEPTSSVDVNTEALILETMERLMQDRTSFLISHRLTALRNCDFVLQIERGGVGVVDADTVPHRRHADV